MMKYTFLILLFTVYACNPSTGPANKEKGDSNPDKAQLLIDELIETYGGKKYLDMELEYDFRDIHYIAKRGNGLYSYERVIGDTIHDKLSNSGFIRLINGKKIDLPDTMAAKYSRSVNSVHYFTLLPYGLNDPAVNKEYLGEVTIEGKQYHKILVYFDKEGGGEDHEDDFTYFINKDTGMMDYFGYIYQTDGGGGRFRKAYNVREVNGIIFQDYINYKPTRKEDTYRIKMFEDLYEEGKMEELSVIELKNIVVK